MRKIVEILGQLRGAEHIFSAHRRGMVNNGADRHCAIGVMGHGLGERRMGLLRYAVADDAGCGRVGLRC